MNVCPKCASIRMSSPRYCAGDGTCGTANCFGREHMVSRCTCGYVEVSPTADAKRELPPGLAGLAWVPRK